MKRTFTLLLAVLLLFLTGCSGSKTTNSVTFYFPKNLRQPGNANFETFYSTETRDHTDAQDLQHFIRAYLQGPLGDDVISPFPENTQLVRLETQDSLVTVHLSREFSQLSGIELTTACACLSLTLFGLTDADQVRIISPESGRNPAVDMTLSRSNLILTDTVTGANGSR